jgi:F0F1-type ATP synthase epsilon subunit
MSRSFRFIVQTPHETVLDATATSVRVPTDTGYVGIRRHMEPMVVPIEAGLAVLRANGDVTLIGSAGGLLTSDGREATLFTPLAVVGTDPVAIQRKLDAALAAPDSELTVRHKLGRLEGRILAELKRGPHDGTPLAGERR